MELDFYKKLFFEAPIGYAHHKIILNEENQPIDFIYLEVNNMFEKLTGMRAELLVQRKFSQMFRRIKKSKLDLLGLYSEVALEGGCKTFDYFSDYLQQWTKAIVFSNEKYFFTILFVDITNERKQVQEMLKNFDSVNEYSEQIRQLSEELNLTRNMLDNIIAERNNLIDEISEIKEQFDILLLQKDKICSIIAHDLRSPFSGMLGVSKILSEELNNLTQDEIHNFTIMLKDSIENTYKLLENLLEWSRLQRGMIPFEPKSFNLGEMVENTVAIHEAKSNEKEILVMNHVPSDLIVFADMNMIDTVLRNLLSNAIKFTPKGGRVEINTRSDENYVEVSVADTGIGIPDEMIPQLFKVGAKTSRSGTEGEASTGFGLILCKELIDKHLGNIWVESQVGKGTKFYFTIPQKEKLR